MLTIRRARKGDIEGICRLGLAMPELAVSERTVFYGDKELFEWVTRQDQNILLVAEEGEAVIGFLFAKIISKEWCMLDNIGVEAAHRGRGIGSLLLKELEGILKIANVNYVQGLVRNDLPGVADFWKKRGYREGNSFVWMEKEI